MTNAKSKLESDSPYAARPWLKHYDFWVPATTTYPRQPAYRTLEIGAMTHPDRPATVFFGREMTFRELKDRAYRMASALAALGVKKGDRVGIMLPNCPQFPISFFGVLRTGATVVAINPAYTPREFERLAADSGINVLIVLDSIAPRMMACAPNTRIEHMIVTGLQHYMPEPVANAYLGKMAEQPPSCSDLKSMAAAAARDAGGSAQSTADVHDFDALIESTALSYLKVDIDPERDVAALQYTGGTTGVSKGAMLTHFNLFANTTQAVVWRSYFKTEEAERVLLVIPLFHVYGLTVGMMIAALLGYTLILIPKFDIEMLLDAFDLHSPTIFPGVPTLYVSLLNHPRTIATDFSKVKYFNSGSAPLPLDVIDRWEALTGCILRQGYGLSETSPTTHAQSILGLRKPESCGIPFPDTECRIVDIETGQHELPVGEPGELCIRGPQVMLGYWNRPDETANALREGGDGKGPWFYTGDIGKMDEDGFFYIVQRKKDMILVSGFNVYPGEIEEVLYAHPAVLEAGVVGVADEYRGERVRAYVALRHGMSATPSDILEHCKTQLTRYKVPAEIVILDNLPKTAVGKILHRALRDIAAEENK
ncbi:MAG TPA: long-chain fatty acid--CoA ligase [Blastocatellia bacterium]|nr:long-chain fatty acid--CoA ligase [Blastocatellia bacterium]